MSNESRQSVAFPVKQGNDTLGYFNLVQDLTDENYAKAEEILLDWIESGKAIPELLESKSGDTFLTLKVGATVLAFFQEQTFSAYEAYEELRAATATVESFPLSNAVNDLF